MGRLAERHCRGEFNRFPVMNGTEPTPEFPADFFFQALPFLTADLPGIGGLLKESPEDFVVEEIPAYEPCGEGEHLFLWIEKRDLSAEEMARRIGRACGIPTPEIGTAGMKDRKGVTRQYVSIPRRCSEVVSSAESDQLKILRQTPHTNKLKTGHLRGNRFEIRLRDVQGSFDQVQQIAARLSAWGYPNYYGDQRFGRDRENLEWGYGLLTGSRSVRKIPFAKRKFLLRLYLSSVQSGLFNLALARRIEAGTVRTVHRGDVLEVTRSGGPFVSEDADVDQQRLDSGEVGITGPIFGGKMKQPSGEPADREESLLREAGLSSEVWGKFPQLTSGTRRAYLIHPDGLTVTEEEAGVFLFRFALPAGAYATVLLREFQKGD